MGEQKPRVSIGMPVYNGEDYLRSGLDSILSQTFSDFEVIICDNDSTDSTEQIGREYAARDPRVRYFKNERNLGPAGNHNRCFSHARGEYFRWQAHDDLIQPTYLEKCVAVLDRDPTVVNCHCKTQVVDEDLQPLREYDFDAGTDSDRVYTRYGKLINVKHRQHVGYEIFGLMRRNVMADTPLELPYAHGDRVFLVRMTLRGRFYELPEKLFLARAHASQSMAQKMTKRLAKYLGPGPMPPPEWWDRSLKGKITFPEWNLLAEYWRAISEVKLDLLDSLYCRGYLALWLGRNWWKLARDLAFAVEQFFLPPIKQEQPQADKEEEIEAAIAPKPQPRPIHVAVP